MMIKALPCRAVHPAKRFVLKPHVWTAYCCRKKGLLTASIQHRCEVCSKTNLGWILNAIVTFHRANANRYVLDTEIRMYWNHQARHADKSAAAHIKALSAAHIGM